MLSEPCCCVPTLAAPKKRPETYSMPKLCGDEDEEEEEDDDEEEEEEQGAKGQEEEEDEEESNTDEGGSGNDASGELALSCASDAPSGRCVAAVLLLCELW